MRWGGGREDGGGGGAEEESGALGGGAGEVEEIGETLQVWGEAREGDIEVDGPGRVDDGCCRLFEGGEGGGGEAEVGFCEFAGVEVDGCF